MGLFGLGFVNDAKREGINEERERNAHRLAEKERQHMEETMTRERLSNAKISEALEAKMCAQHKAMLAEKEAESKKAEMAREAAEAQLRLTMDSNEKLMNAQREADQKRSEIERKAREEENRLRIESEQKLERERQEARLRDEQNQKKVETVINLAKANEMKMKDEANAEVTRLITESQKMLNDQQKDNQAIMNAKDAENAKIVNGLKTSYDNKMKETVDVARQREDVLHLERSALVEQHKSDLENHQHLSKEDRDKMMSEHQAMIKEKDDELSKNRQEKEAKMDQLRNNHFNDLKNAHDEQNKLQERMREEANRLQKEKEELVRESAANERMMNNKMIEFMERKNEQLLAVCNQAMMVQAVQMKNRSEILRVTNGNEEIAPIKGIKKEMVELAKSSCDLWTDLERDDAEEIKRKIIEKSMAMKKTFDRLLQTIDESRSLGEKRKAWKDQLKKLSNGIATYNKSVTRQFRNKDITQERLDELQDECDLLKEAIQELDIEAESMESLLDRQTQEMLKLAPNLNEKMTIAAAAGNETGTYKQAIEEQ